MRKDTEYRYLPHNVLMDMYNEGFTYFVCKKDDYTFSFFNDRKEANAFRKAQKWEPWDETDELDGPFNAADKVHNVKTYINLMKKW